MPVSPLTMDRGFTVKEPIAYVRAAIKEFDPDNQTIESQAGEAYYFATWSLLKRYDRETQEYLLTRASELSKHEYEAELVDRRTWERELVTIPRNNFIYYTLALTIAMSAWLFLISLVR